MWSVLFGWIVQAAIITALIGAAFGVLSMTPPHHNLSETFFTIAAILLIARLGWWLAFEVSSLGGSWVSMLLFSFVIFGIIGSLWYAAMRWIEELKLSSPSANELRLVPESNGSHNALPSQPASAAPQWEPGFEKEIRTQLQRTMPEVHRLLKHLTVYGPRTEPDLLLKFGDGIIRLAEEEHFIDHYNGKIDVADRFRPILSKIIYEYADES